jgi:hypothetical protein
MVNDLWGIEPDRWQHKALSLYPTSPRLAMKACTGPGKTAVLAWIGWNFLLTRPFSIIGATSISGANLKTGLWTELARWYNASPVLQRLFDMTKTEIFSREHPQTWKIEARTWAADADANQIGNALRGLHAKYVMWLLDESGDYPDAILPIVEAIFSGNPVEAHIVQAGNPTRLGGPLYQACVTARKYWEVVEITGDPDDPDRSPRISLEHARQQIAQYGRDNPWVMVNIFGQFPPQSFDALFGVEEVRAAMKMRYRQEDIDASPRILGVDVARYGDDASVIFPRQGLVAFKPLVMRNVNSLTGAGQVARTWQDWNADAVFIDSTGGFGSGWIDQLENLRRHPIGVGFAERAMDPKYFNRRAEMFFALRDWIRRGGCLPDDTDLIAELPTMTFTPKGGRLLIEPKEAIKARLGRSPDKSDSLALTFAEPIAGRAQDVMPVFRQQKPYDPFASVLGR